MLTLRRVFVVHAVVVFAASIVLVVAPSVIPATVGIVLEPKAYLLSYFLAAAELGLAFLSFGARDLTDPRAVRLVVRSFVVFHGATALLEVYAQRNHFEPVLVVNVLVRAGVIALLVIVGRRPYPEGR